MTPRPVVAFALASLLAPSLALADGPPGGFPICTAPGDQLAPLCLPGGTFGLLFWQDLRGLPADAGDIWFAGLNEGIIGRVPPADGAPLVQRPGGQAQPAAASVLGVNTNPSQYGPHFAEVLAYTDLPNGSLARSVRATRFNDEAPDQWDSPASLSSRDVSDPMVVDDQQPVPHPTFPGGTLGTGVIVAWLESSADGTTSRLRAQHLGVDGARLWGDTGIPVVTDTTGQSAAAMLPAPGGGATFAWVDSRLGDPLAIFAMRIGADGNPAPGWPAAGVLVRTSANLPQAPRIAPDGAGGVFVLWEELETLADQSHGLQPRVLRLQANGSLAPGWPADGVRLVVRDATPLYTQDFQNDGAGGVVAAVRSYDGSVGRVIVQRLLADGSRAAGWPDVGLDACTVAGDESEAKLSAEAEVTTVVWTDARVSALDTDISAARFAADGTRPEGWPAAGLLVGSAPGIQRSPVIAPGCCGGVLVAWQDFRDGTTTGADIWGQTVSVVGRLDAGDDAAPLGLTLTFAGPQPARGAARFRLALPTSGRVRAEVFDVSGRRVASVWEGVLTAGAHALTWDGRSGAEAATAGVRFLRVRTQDGERTLRFVSLR